MISQGTDLFINRNAISRLCYSQHVVQETSIQAIEAQLRRHGLPDDGRHQFLRFSTEGVSLWASITIDHSQTNPFQDQNTLVIMTESEKTLAESVGNTGLILSAVQEPLLACVASAVKQANPFYLLRDLNTGTYMFARDNGHHCLIRVRVFGSCNGLFTSQGLSYEANNEEAQTALDLILFANKQGEIEHLAGYLPPKGPLPNIKRPLEITLKPYGNLYALCAKLWCKVLKEVPKLYFSLLFSRHVPYTISKGRYIKKPYNHIVILAGRHFSAFTSLLSFVHEFRHFLQENFQDKITLLKEEDIRAHLPQDTIQTIREEVRPYSANDKNKELDARYVTALFEQALKNGTPAETAIAFVHQGIKASSRTCF